jgi:hypothetical protein
MKLEIAEAVRKVGKLRTVLQGAGAKAADLRVLVAVMYYAKRIN